MNHLDGIYRPSIALLTDLYQLTMAYGYWKNGRAEDEAIFHLYFRRAPFGGHGAVACGMAMARDLVESFHFDKSDVDYLETLTGNNGEPLFEQAFLDYLADLRFEGEIHAVTEGEVVFSNQPLLRVQAPIILGQLLETPLLNIVNFQTLIATKAARICTAAGDDPVIEFGLRRAQGIDGGLSASRAAYIGGCVGTSNVLAGKLFDIPVKGTHAHSWVMSFDSEIESFEAYAAALPNNCIFLVDTYETVEGVRRAIEVGLQLRQRGYEMAGIRLDSGDLVELSQQARQLLDEAGFPEAVIVASNDLDETAITELKARGAAIGVWGIGTKLATAWDQPALGGVYKLGAIRSNGTDDWRFTMKISRSEPAKSSLPGILNVRRTEQGDVIYCETEQTTNTDGRNLLTPLREHEDEPIKDTRARTQENLLWLKDHPHHNTTLSPPLAERCEAILTQ